jgi:hypothetical protein
MTKSPQPKFPVPVEATNFVFLSSPAAPMHAVLEFHTATNPVRIFLTKPQLVLLAAKAAVAANKIQG